ncbi:hypothetical protein KRR55_09680 [Paeniglutamicibacter sp. ABSL32-1]|uniref:hypothetical protein n=1 Tax=Paeniglutamicibacter quisquiliarum TaxID=2849498 RepID=UPI001C2D683F|nr:hypothetical protein [Paeniglutamicibacter quisquiliarum]MBV1779381.1 hypothetical protein [Paeniglutamicibacter quisquiliarum]
MLVNSTVARSSSKNADFVGMAMAGIGVLSGVLLPVIWWDANVSIVLIVLLVGFAAGAGTFMFAKGRLPILLFFVVFFGVLLWFRNIQSIQGGTGGLGLTWFTCVIAGTIIGANFRPDKKKKAKKLASGALLLTGNDGRKLFEDDAPSATSLVGSVRSLDGKKRTLVSAMRGGARMDFCGGAEGAMVVYFSPDTSDDRLWNMMTTPGSEHGQTEVAIGDLEGSFENWETTTVERAIAAARHFASTGQADPTLTWYASEDVCERRPLAS